MKTQTKQYYWLVCRRCGCDFSYDRKVEFCRDCQSIIARGEKKSGIDACDTGHTMQAGCAKSAMGYFRDTTRKGAREKC